MIFAWDRLNPVVHTIFHVKETREWEIPSRQNPFSAIWFMLKGNLSGSCGEENFKAGAGDVLLFPPDTPFQAKIDPNCPFLRIIGIRFTLATEQNIDWLRIYRLPVLLKNPDDSANKRDFLNMLLTFKHPSPLHLFRVKGMFHLVLGCLLEHNIDAIRPKQFDRKQGFYTVFQVMQWIENHLREKITLPELAALVHISPDYLNQLFNQHLGVTAIQYLNQRRVQQAKQLLQHRFLLVKDICRMVGIEDAHYFSRLFKAAEGITPVEYREFMLKL